MSYDLFFNSTVLRCFSLVRKIGQISSPQVSSTPTNLLHHLRNLRCTEDPSPRDPNRPMERPCLGDRFSDQKSSIMRPPRSTQSKCLPLASRAAPAPSPSSTRSSLPPARPQTPPPSANLPLACPSTPSCLPAWKAAYPPTLPTRAPSLTKESEGKSDFFAFLSKVTRKIDPPPAQNCPPCQNWLVNFDKKAKEGGGARAMEGRGRQRVQA
jgi:hypothetical protein